MAKKIKIRTGKVDDEPETPEQTEEAAKLEAGIQDEFQAKGFELVEWLHDHPTIVLGAIGVVLAGGLVLGASSVIRGSRNESASAAYGKAVEAYEAPLLGDATPDKAKGPTYKDATERAKASRELFRAVTRDHDGTGAAELAQLYVGHASLKLGEYDEAVKAYEAFLSETGKNDELRFAGLEGLATALDAKGDTKGAIAKLEELVELKSTVEKDAALLELGRLYKAAGDNEKAKKVLARIPSELPDSPLKTRAEEQLTALGGTAPAPAAPATP